MKTIVYAVLAVLFFNNLCSAGIVGDINGDGKVDLAEAIYALQVASGTSQIPESCSITMAGQWMAGKTYQECDVVDSNGAYYASVQNHISEEANMPPSEGVWIALALQGEQGPPGPQGIPGLQGVPGLHCWDTNDSGVCDIGEDLNGDQTCTVDDCRPAIGENLSNPGDRVQLGGNVWLEVGPDGQIEIRTDTQRYRLVKLDDAWSHPVSLFQHINVSGNDATMPKVVMNNNGNAIITWRQMVDGVLQIFKSQLSNGVWSRPHSLTDNISPDGQHAQLQQVAMDDNGNAIIVWTQNDSANSQIFKSEYRNGSWSHPSGLSDNISPDGTNVYAPQVAMDNEGNAIIVWYQLSADDVLQVFKSEYRNGVWSHPSGLTDSISPAGTHAGGPMISMDDNGNAIIVWFQDDGYFRQIFKSEFRNGAWAHPADLSDNISPNGSKAISPHVAMDNNGNAVVVWYQKEGDLYQIFKSEYRNGSWIHPSSQSDNISPDDSSVYNGGDTAIHLAMNNSGNSVIVWTQANGSQYQIYKSEYRNGLWKHPSNLSDSISTGEYSAVHPRVAIDGIGNAIIVYTGYDGGDNRIFKSEYRNSVWLIPVNRSDFISRADGNNASLPQVAADSFGHVIVVWDQDDGTASQIFKSEYHNE